MADLKITALPALAEAGIQATDVLALADISATETKKITVKDLIAAGVALIDDADIPAAKVGTLGTDQVTTGALVDGSVTNVKLANSSISLGGVSIALGATDATPAFNLADATGYTTANLSGTITNAQLAGSIAGIKLLDTTISYSKLNLADGDIPGAKLTSSSVTSSQLAANSVGASELADNSVDTAAIANGAVVAASIATDTITANQIAANAIGSSELADNAVDAGAIAADAVTTVKILNANVTAAKLAANLPGSILATGAIGSTQLAANSVTASELADNAVDSGAIAASAVVDAKIASGIGGAKITDGTITAAKLATANIDRSLNVASGNLGINNTVVAATRSGITYNAQGLITGTVALAASDLPLATTSAVGAVSVGTGLAVTGAGALSLSNSVTAATISGITYNAQGQITATTALVAGDLPAATTSAKGAVQITSGGGISVDGSGAISTSTSGITAGTYAKVTVNNKGVATAGASLVAGDIPNLAATKITSGTFDVGRFGTNTILGSKLADSSVCQFTGAQSTSGVVTFPTAEFKGQFFYDLTNDDLYVYDGSAFQPVTITSGEIIYAGNYRADTNKITSLTAAGTAQGFTVGAALQASSAANNRYYFVVDKSGTGTSPAPTVTINPPDMILSNGTSWEKLDISNFIAGQVASNIGVTATGGIQNTNVQSVLEELDTEKLNLTGGTLTGNLALNQSSSIIFEGSTPDDFETTLTVIDPTADRTVSLPNVTGTLVSSGDTGTVTSTMILDGTIVNADINASAAIALTKLANVTAAHIIVGNASNVPTAVAVTGDISISNAGLVAITADSIVNADIKSDADIAGTKILQGTTSARGTLQLTDSAASSSTTTAATPAAVKIAKDAADAAATTANAALPTSGGTLTNNLIIDNAKQIRFTEADANGANYVSLQAPDTLAADVSYTLPNAAPTANGQVLASTTGGVLSWTDDPTGQWVTNGTNVYYDGGNVGIGTGSTPGAELHVKGLDVALRLESTAATGRIGTEFYDTSAQKGFFGYPSSGNDNMCIQQNEAADFYIDVNGSTRMRIDSSGHVGIGVTPSAWPTNADSKALQIGTGFVAYGRGSGDQDRGGIAVNYYNDGSSEKYIADGHANRIYMNDGNIEFQYAAENSNGAGAALSWTTGMRMKADGNVGIGTTSPTKPSSSNNSTRFMEIASGDGADLILSNNVSTNIGAGAHIGTLAFKNIDDTDGGAVPHYAGIRCESANTSGSMDLRFYVGRNNLESDAPNMMIDASGNVLIGSITTAGAEFHVKGGGTVAKFEGTGGNGFISLADADDNTQLFLGCDGGSFKIQTSGNGWADKLTLNVAGHLGLKTAPNAGWSVGTDINVLQLKNGVLWDYAGVQTDLGQNFYYTGSGYKFIIGNYASRITQHNNDGHIGFWSGGTGSADGDITWAERMHIKADGNVGIGESSPGRRLTVKSGAHFGFEGTNSGYPYLGDTPVVAITTDGNNGSATSYADKAILLVGRGGGGKVGTTYGGVGVTTELFRVDMGGDVKLLDGDLKVADGHGINFSAYATSGNPSSNLLDDYEEGTWTVVLKYYDGSSWNNVSYSSNPQNTTGHYTKIGNMVRVAIYMGAMTISTGYGYVGQVAGLPFTTSSTAYNLSVGTFSHTNVFQEATNTGYTQGGQAGFRPTVNGSTSSSTWQNGSKYLIFSLTYFV